LHKGFPERFYPGGHTEENQRKVENNARLLSVRTDDDEGPRKARDSFVSACELTYGELTYLSVHTRHGSVFFYFKAGDMGATDFQTLEILQRERLIEILRADPSGTGAQIGYFNVTPIGIDFVRDCSPQADEMAARRPPPVQPIPVSKEQSDKIIAALREKERRTQKPPTSLQGGFLRQGVLHKTPLDTSFSDDHHARRIFSALVAAREPLSQCPRYRRRAT